MGEFILKYWIEVALGLVCSVFGFVIKHITTKVKRINERQKAVENGVLALLRNAMLQEYRKFKSLGEIPIIDKQNFEHMYKEYHALGGNDIGTQMYEEILKMKTKIIEE